MINNREFFIPGQFAPTDIPVDEMQIFGKNGAIRRDFRPEYPTVSNFEVIEVINGDGQITRIRNPENPDPRPFSINQRPAIGTITFNGNGVVKP